MRKLIIEHERLARMDYPVFGICILLKNAGFDPKKGYDRKDDFFNGTVIFEQKETECIINNPEPCTT